MPGPRYFIARDGYWHCATHTATNRSSLPPVLRRSDWPTAWFSAGSEAGLLGVAWCRCLSPTTVNLWFRGRIQARSQIARIQINGGTLSSAQCRLHLKQGGSEAPFVRLKGFGSIV